MDFFEVIDKRHCCRKFNPNKKVADKLLDKIVDAGKKAPSAGGFKSMSINIIKNQKDKEKVLSCIPETMQWAANASAILVITSTPKFSFILYGERAKKMYIYQDSAAMAENIFLATVALGLSTCWIGTFDDEQLAKALKLKSGQQPMVVMPIGYAA